MGSLTMRLPKFHPICLTYEELLFKLHFAREADALALARLDIDGGTTIIEDIEGVEIGIFIVLHINHYSEN